MLGLASRKLWPHDYEKRGYVLRTFDTPTYLQRISEINDSRKRTNNGDSAIRKELGYYAARPRKPRLSRLSAIA